jgi:hypothetical protein
VATPRRGVETGRKGRERKKGNESDPLLALTIVLQVKWSSSTAFLTFSSSTFP